MYLSVIGDNCSIMFNDYELIFIMTWLLDLVKVDFQVIDMLP